MTPTTRDGRGQSQVKLSPAQQRFMEEVRERGFSSPPWGSHDSGRWASAWHRTARSLDRLGLVYTTRQGHGFAARLALTDEQKAAGLAVLEEAVRTARAKHDSTKRRGGWGITLNNAWAKLSHAEDELREFRETHHIKTEVR